MVKRLDGKICIMSGAGTGIGEAIAHKFAKEGATVVISTSCPRGAGGHSDGTVGIG